MSEEIKKLLKEKDKIYERLLFLLEKQAKGGILNGGNNSGNAEFISDKKTFPNINTVGAHMTLTQAMNNSFSRIRKYSKQDI